MDEKANHCNFQDLPSEENIKSNWGHNQKIKVSICMLSYNHEKYLDGAISSVLTQKTNSPFELLVHDDASQDRSQEIIKKYAKKYPSIVKPILQNKNQHSQRINPSVHFNYPRCSGEYTAFLEGDDFWIDENKLQSQINSLDQNKSINLCFHKAVQINYFSKDTVRTIISEYANENTIIPYMNIFFRTHGMIATGSCMIRNSAKEKLRIFMQSRPYLTLGDLFMQFFGAYPNGAYYINKTMSAYRFGTDGSWTANINSDPEHKIRHEKSLLLAYSELNKLSNNKLKKEINKIHLQRLLWFFRPQHNSNFPLQNTILDRTNPASEILKDIGIQYLSPKFQYIQENIISTLKSWQSISGDKIIYGSGSGCKIIIDSLGSLNITAIIDRDKKRIGETVNSTPLIAIEEVKNYPASTILVSIPSVDKSTLNKELSQYNIPTENIHYLFESATNWLLNNPLKEDELLNLKNSHNFGKVKY